MSTKYQKEVNNLTGAMGPDTSAFWNPQSAYTGTPWTLNSAPLYFSPSSGVYVTASESSGMGSSSLDGPSNVGVIGSWNPSVGPVSKIPNAYGSRRSRKAQKGQKGCGFWNFSRVKNDLDTSSFGNRKVRKVIKSKACKRKNCKCKICKCNKSKKIKKVKNVKSRKNNRLHKRNRSLRAKRSFGCGCEASSGSALLPMNFGMN